MRTREPADKHYGERRPLGPGIHVEKQGFARAKAGSHTGSSDPRSFGVNPMNWAPYAADGAQARVMASPYGDTTVVLPGEGLQVTRPTPAWRQVDSGERRERPNRKPLGMNTGVGRFGGGPQRNVPKA